MLRRLYRLGMYFLQRRYRRYNSSAKFWTDYNVTQHHKFSSIEDSLSYMSWRNDIYPGYIERLPVAGHDGKVVLDYGCGPGHDLVGFGHCSKPAKLIGMEVSPTSLEQARSRLAMHQIDAELILIDEQNPRLPLEDASVDYIHSSGVLHHIADPLPVLREFRRILRPGGEVRVMVYNEDSLFVHLHAAYVIQIEEGRYADMSLAEAFRHLTDGENCPISRYYSPASWSELASPAGFEVEHIGNGISMYEISLAPHRYIAIQDRRLAAEHRQFLLDIRLDDRGYPLYRGHYAGTAVCFRMCATS